MKIKLIWLGFILGTGVAFWGSGCASVEQTGRSRLMLYSESAERQAGDAAWAEVKQQEKRSGNTTAQSALRRVGGTLIAASGENSGNWEFVVFASSVPNAFALPGGHVAVYEALFQYTDNDAELATVLGHEIGHVLARHGGERMSQAAMQQWVGALLGAATDSGELAMIAYGAATELGVILPFSRKHEYEADYIGLLLMADAGYDPAAAIAFWKKFSQLSGSSRLESYFSTHPLGSDRIEALEKHLPEARARYEAAAVKRGTGNRLSGVVRTSAR